MQFQVFVFKPMEIVLYKTLAIISLECLYYSSTFVIYPIDAICDSKTKIQHMLLLVGKIKN